MPLEQILIVIILIFFIKFPIFGQIDVFIGIIREVRTTEAMKQAERRSLIITVFATASVFACLVNFCVVVVFLDTLANLRFIY